MPKTGADLLVETLIAAGVKHLFTLSGNHIMPIFDATIGRDIQLIHTRHEAAAVHMADGWGRMTEQPGLALLTAGPGHCNAISALYVALMAESPLVLLSGHAPLGQLGRGGFQEVDQVAIANPVTKAAWLVEEVDQLSEAITTALDLARSGRPGPVHLSLPSNVLETSVSVVSPNDNPGGLAKTKHEASHKISSSSPKAEDAPIDKILDFLSDAKRPLILTGPAMGRPQRWADVAQLSTDTGIPALPMESPRGVNDPWLHRATNLLAEADVVLLVGKKLDFSLRFGQPPFFAAGCRFIKIEADQTQLREDERVALALWADPTPVVRQLTAVARERTWQARSWRDEVMSARHAVPSEWQAWRHSPQQPLHPLRICEALQPFLAEGAIFVSDGGEFGQWVQAGLEAETRLINGPSGSIGSSLPLGVAAKLAQPQRQVFVLLGDGTFGYHAMEFDTALRYNLPIIAIVGNDARWNAEHQIQLRNYGPERTVGCDLLPSRYDQVVRALGGHGELVQHPADLTPALERAVASGLPACINVMIDSLGAPTLRSNGR